MKYKTINLNLFPIDSEVSQYKIEQTCNAYAEAGWKVVNVQVIDDDKVEIVLKK